MNSNKIAMSLRIVLIGTCCLFLGAVIFNFERLRQSNTSVLQVGAEYLSSAYQLHSDLQRLIGQLHPDDDPENTLDLATLRLSVDLLWSRLPPLEVVRDSALPRHPLDAAKLLADLEVILERVGERVEREVTDRGAYEPERFQLEAMVEPIQALASHALQQTGHVHGELQQRLDAIYSSNIAASIGLGIAILALLSLYGFQRSRSRQLIEAHERDNATIDYLAFHDVLTGLPNRRLFHQRLAHAVAEAKRDSRFVALHLIDLDQFKSVNDCLGHTAGDQVLKEAAHRMSAAVPECDLLARVAGDEFAIIQTKMRSREAAGTLDDRLLSQFSRPFNVSGQSIMIGTSIGTTVFPDDGDVCHELLANADVALHQAKSNGRRQSILFDDNLLAAELDRRWLASRLQSATCYDELSLRYQPKFSVRTHNITGVEVLLRWDRGAGPAVGPGEFIPIAESSGAIMPIGDWVIRTACREMISSGLANYPIAINLSPIQLKDQRCARRIIETLRRAGFPAADVEFEITETSLLSDDPIVLANIEQLHEAGADICLDDFGTGYSSLSHLQALPLSAMKLDRSFVAKLDDYKTRCICQGIAALGHRLGLRIVGEGAETQDQWDELVRIGCDQVQGYYLGRPMTIDSLRTFLREHQSAQEITASVACTRYFSPPQSRSKHH